MGTVTGGRRGNSIIRRFSGRTGSRSDPNWIGPTQRTVFIQVRSKGTKSEVFLGLKKPAQPTLAVFGELEQKVFPLAAVCNMPDMIWLKIPMNTGHRAVSLRRSFPPRKAASKLQYRAYFRRLGFVLIDRVGPTLVRF